MTKINKITNFIYLVCIKLLECNDETNRVESLCEEVLISQGYENINIFVTSTGVFYSFSDKKNTYNNVVRIKKRGTNLTIISSVDKICKNLINKEIKIEEAIKDIKSIKSDHSKFLFKAFIAGLSTGFFAMLYGGNIEDFLIAFICGFCIQSITMSFRRIDIFHFINSFLGSVTTAVIAIIFINIFKECHFDRIVIGSIMLILPGLSLTNSIKDVLTGNLVSGGARFLEAIIVALAISSGVGLVLYVYNLFGGVI